MPLQPRFLLRAWRGSLILATVLTLAACRRQSLTLEHIIDRNAEATGGRAAIEAVQSIEVELHITDPGFEVDGIYRAARPGKMRIDVTAGGKHVFTEAFNGRRGWQWEGKGDAKDATATATAALRHGVELPGKLFGLHEMQPRGHRLELARRERVNSIDYQVLQLTMADGYTTSLYVDPSSWLITRRRDIRPLHVDIDPTPTTIEAQSSDFRAVAGVLFGFAGVDLDLPTGKVLERTAVKSIKVNPQIDPQIFEKL